MYSIVFQYSKRRRKNASSYENRGCSAYLLSLIFFVTLHSFLLDKHAAQRHVTNCSFDQTNAFYLFVCLLLVCSFSPRVHSIPQGPRISAVVFYRPRCFGTAKDDAKMRRLLLVPKTGLEPVRMLLRGILSPLRLPIPPLRRLWRHHPESNRG